MSRRPLGADAAYATPADLLKAGTPTDEIHCVVCGSSWDGDAELSARPLCPAHRAEVGQWLAAAVDIVLASRAQPDTQPDAA